MEPIVVSIDELTNLLHVVGELSNGLSRLECFEPILASLSKLIPFEHCAMLHERLLPVGRRTFRYEFINSSIKAGRRIFGGPEPSNIERFIGSLRITSSFRNAFLWDPAGCATDHADAAPLALFGRPALAHGIGASARHLMDGGANDSATMILLQHSGDAFEERHLAMLNSIIRPLHLTMQRDSAVMEASANLSALTAKEAEVMQWVVEGKTSWEVGKILSISERTVKFHLANIYSKFNVANRVQAVSAITRGHARPSAPLESKRG